MGGELSGDRGGRCGDIERGWCSEGGFVDGYSD